MKPRSIFRPTSSVGDSQTTSNSTSTTERTAATDMFSSTRSSSSTLSITQGERDVDGCYDDVGFMFDSAQPSTLKRLVWESPNLNDGDDEEQDAAPLPVRVQVALHVVDEEPGALQSGHYLWPAAPAMAEFLIDMAMQQSPQQQQQPSLLLPIRTPRNVLELGAGCALLSLTVLQVMSTSLQCVMITDHDPGTLVRATDNYETTLEELLESTTTEDEQMDCINGLASIPVLFEGYTWGDAERAYELATAALEHASATTASPLLQHQHATNNTLQVDPERNVFDLILGSDLIYSPDVVQPLLQSVAHLMTYNGSFLLATSFIYDDETEQCIDDVCQKLQLQRTTLKQEELLVEACGMNRALCIQQFTWNLASSSQQPEQSIPSISS